MEGTSSRRSARGFTLIELMLVVGIIGALAAVALPAYQGYLVRSRVAEGLVLAQAVEKTVSDYRDRWGRLPADNAAAGLPAPASLRGAWVSAIQVREGSIEVRFVPELVKGSEPPTALLLRPVTDPASPTGPLGWVCHAGSAPAGRVVPPVVSDLKMVPTAYRPARCR